jgi:hypothetical protein
VIFAKECAVEKRWTHLWIESDSKLANLKVKSPNIVPWQIKNRWLNCLQIKSCSYVGRSGVEGRE